MRFACIAAPEGHTQITCEPGDYDAHPPVRLLKIANRIRFVHPDRLAVCCALLFAKYVSGSLRTEKDFGPATATALRRFFEPRKLLFESVSLVPAAIPVGDRNAVVIGEPEAGRVVPPGAVRVELADDHAFSSYLSAAELRFSTNVRLFAAASQERTSALIALATLFAEDFSIRRIISFRAGHANQEHIDRSKQLLAAVNIALEIVD
jgi:hypothetical protein